MHIIDTCQRRVWAIIVGSILPLNWGIELTTLDQPIRAWKGRVGWYREYRRSSLVTVRRLSETPTHSDLLISHLTYRTHSDSDDSVQYVISPTTEQAWGV
jgi:hypothetical protein